MEKIKINKKTLNIIFLILLLIIPISLSVYFRAQPASLPAMDNYAMDNVASALKQDIRTQIQSSHAYLSKDSQDALVNEEYKNYVDNNKEFVKSQVDLISQQFKDGVQDENGYTYLIAIDPWMQYQYTKNYLETGTVGDVVIDGTPYVSLRDGRTLRTDANRFHPWLMAQFHKILHFFNEDITPMRSVFFFPLLWVSLAVIPAFFIGRKLSNNMGGFIAATIVAVHRTVLSRTVAGFSDTDSHNVFFPLYIMWFAIEAYSAKDTKQSIIYGALAGLFTGIYSLAWSGWWYTFDFIFISFAGFLIYKILNDRESFKKGFKTIKKKLLIATTNLGTYFLSAMVFVIGLQTTWMGKALSDSIHTFGAAFRMPFTFLKYQEVGITTIWPNVFTTVAELNQASASSVISSLGKPLLFFLSLLGIILLMKDFNKKTSKIESILIGASIVWYLIVLMFYKQITDMFLLLILIAAPVAVIALHNITQGTKLKIKYSILFVIFFTGTFLAATRGIRFAALLVPVFAILVGISSGKIYSFVSDWVIKSLNINKILVRTVFVILILMITLPATINAGWSQSVAEIPTYNDAWDDTLKTINQSSEDAIITSWWDFGHWFVAGSERRVTFDGGSQSSRIHWVGRELLTNNETEALNIARMLNCGQNNARFKLEDAYNDDYKAIKTLYSILKINDKEKARIILEDSGLNQEDVEYVLNNTYCDDLIDQYFIASEDMIGKSGVWGHFGIWDFDRAYLFNKVKDAKYNDAIKFLTEEMGYSGDKAKQLYLEIQPADGDQWISPWPRYLSGETRCVEQDEMIGCNNGLIYNTTSQESIIRTEQGVVKNRYLSTIIDGEFTLIEYPEYSDDVGAALYRSGNGYSSILTDGPQTASMFTRLYFFGGAGLEHFELISQKAGIDGVDIYLYKVNW